MNTRILLVTFLRMISSHRFANISNKMNSKFQNFDDNCSWKGPKSIHSFRFKKISNEDIKTYLGSLPNKSTKDILGMDLVLLRVSPIYMYFCWQIFSLANVINKSHKSGVFEQDWKNTRVTPIYEDDGDINDENNYRPISVIDHIAKMIESLVSYQIIDFLKSIVLFQWSNLFIWKDTSPKLAFIVL